MHRVVYAHAFIYTDCNIINKVDTDRIYKKFEFRNKIDIIAQYFVTAVSDNKK